MVQKTSRKVRTYSEDLKLKVVSEVRLGLSYSHVSRKYGIMGKMTVSRWCSLYGCDVVETTLDGVPLRALPSPGNPYNMPKKESPLDDASIRKSLEDRLKLLEYELLLYKKLVEIAKRDHDLDLLKKPGTKPSRK